MRFVDIESNAVTEVIGRRAFRSRADIQEFLDNIPTAEVIEVSKVSEAKQNLLQIVDEFIAEYRHISQSYVDHFGGKADAMETARRLIDKAFTNLTAVSEEKQYENN
jgi:hypothetical protein